MMVARCRKPVKITLVKSSDIRLSMVTHTRNLCSAINPSKVHTQQWTHKHTPVVLGGILVHTEYRCLSYDVNFLIPQYWCHLNNVRNVTLLERGLFSLLHFSEDTPACVTKHEGSETEAVALVECDEREEVIHNIHIDRHKYPPSAAISSRISHIRVRL